MGGYGAVLRNGRFLRLWLGQAISNLGDAVYGIAVILLVTTQTRSPLAISLVTLAQVVPMIVVGPLAGVLVDRWEKKRVMVLADVVRAALVLVPLVSHSLPVLYAVSLLVATLNLFFMPARQTVVPEIVGRDDLMTAVGLQQVTAQTVRLIGPAFGGALVGVAGFGAAFVLDALSFALSAAATLSVAIPRIASRGGERFWASFREGVGFLVRTRPLRFLVQMMTLSVIGLGFVGVLMVDYTRNVLGVDARTFGLLEASLAAATVAAGAVVAQRGRALPRLPLIFAGFALVAAPGLIYLLRPPIELVFVWAILLGLGEGTLMVPLTTVFVERTPVEKRGRVFAATNAIANSMSLVGIAGAGAVAAWIGSWNGLALASGFTLAVLVALRLSAGYAAVREDTAVSQEVPGEGSNQPA